MNHSRWPVWKASTLAGVLWVLFGGIEAALILTLRVRVFILKELLASALYLLTEETQPLYKRGIDYPMLILGILASILLALGLIPPYFEIWKRKGRVVGFNWVC